MPYGNHQSDTSVGYGRTPVQNDRRLVFRYHDPRVLRVYLPSCTADEWQQFLGPIEAFFMEGENGSCLVGMTRVGQQLKQERVELPALHRPRQDGS